LIATHKKNEHEGNAIPDPDVWPVNQRVHDADLKRSANFATSNGSSARMF
jgi:hypothetical protein